MSVNLQKGQKVELRKNNGGELRRVMVGLGWDEVQQSRGFFAPKPQDIDCDASAFICKNGRMTAMVFGELYRYNGTWKFNAIGQATQDNSVGDLAKRFV